MQSSLVDLLVKNVVMSSSGVTTSIMDQPPTALQILAEIASSHQAAQVNTSVQQIISTMLAMSSSQNIIPMPLPSSSSSSSDALTTTLNLKRVNTSSSGPSIASTSFSEGKSLKDKNSACRTEIGNTDSKPEMLSSSISPQERILSLMNPFGINAAMLPRNLQISAQYLKKPKLETNG